MSRLPMAAAEYSRAFAESHTINDVTGSAPWAYYDPTAQGAGNITQLTDFSGNARHAIRNFGDGSGLESTISIQSNGVGKVFFHHAFYVENSTPTDFTFCAAIHVDMATTQVGRSFFLGQCGGIFFGMAVGIAGVITVSVTDGGNSVLRQFTQAGDADKVLGKLVITISHKVGAATRIYFNGLLMVSSNTTVSTGNPHTILGAFDSGYATQWGDYLGKVGIWSSELTDSQRARAEALIGNGDKMWDKIHILVTGNSVSAGGGMPDDRTPYRSSQAWPAQMQDMLGDDYFVTNLAIHGQNWQGMIDNEATQVGEVINHYAPNQIVISFEGENQTLVSDAAGVYAKAREYHLRVRAMGVLMIGATSNFAPDKIDWEPSNEDLRDNWREFLDAPPAEIALHPLLGYSAARPGPYYQDHVHLTELGNNVLADLMKSKVLEALAIT